MVESKRRSFIVSRVPEHTVIKDKIAEDESEDATQDQPSPESTQSSIRALHSPSLLQLQQQHPSDGDISGISDSEKSLKSQGGKAEVPVNINDLEEQLTRLTRGGSAVSQADLTAPVTDSHSPVSSEESSATQQQQQQQGSAQIPQQQQLQQQSQPSHQISVEKLAPSDSSSLVHEKPTQPVGQSQPPNVQQTQQTTQQQQQQMPSQHPQPAVVIPQQHHQQPSGQPQQSMPVMMPQGQPPVHQQSSQSISAPIQQPPVLAGQHKPIQAQGSAESMPANPNMPSGMFPQAMSYFPMMQPPMYGYPHHHPSGMMQMIPDQLHAMQYFQFGQMPNQMVPYVMVNVQQQHQVAPMWVPANMFMPNQMQYMGSQTGTHMPHQHSDAHSEPLMSSPPSTPPQSRKQHSIDAQSEPGVSTSEISSPAPMRSNYSIASLEQELIRKLHGGTRKDIPLASGASGSMLNESYSQTIGEAALQRLHEDKPQWTQSSESLTSVNSAPADPSEGLKRVEEVDHVDGESAPTPVKEAKEVIKKLRFQVERVKDDPLKLDSTSDFAQKSVSSEVQSESVSGDKEAKSEKDEIPVSKPAKRGRFSVTKVVEKSEDVKTFDSPSTQTLPSENKNSSEKESVIDRNTEQCTSDTNVGAEVKATIADVPHTIHEETEDKLSTSEENPNQASAEITSVPDKPHVSKIHLHDLPYRKKSMSFFEGNSPMLSNNTCDSFYNTHMDRFQIFSRRRTKSLGSIQSVGSLQSISMQTQCTQYGDGETPSPSPSPREQDFPEFPEVVFDLASVRDDLSSSDSGKDDQDGAESGIDSGSRIISPRPPLRRQARKVTCWPTIQYLGHVDP